MNELHVIFNLLNEITNVFFYNHVFIAIYDINKLLISNKFLIK